MEIPDVRYLRTDRGSIAYQRFGHGDRTIVWTSPPLVSIEIRWSRAGSERMWTLLASLGEVVLFDYRGLGSSTPIPTDRVGQLDEMSFDLEAVTTELVERPLVLIATGVATIPAVTFAARNPGRVERLVLLNATAFDPRRERGDPDGVISDLLSVWGTGKAFAQAVGLAIEPSQRWEAGRSERQAAAPEVLEALTRAMLGHDVTPELAKIDVPTLVIHTGDLVTITPAMSEAVASAIPGARFLLRPSSSFNWGDWDSDIQEFITGSADASTGHRDLAAVMFTDIANSTAEAARRGDATWRQTLEQFDAFVSRALSSGQGRIVKQTGDGHLIECARPGDALKLACRLVDEVPLLGIQVRVGVHFGEVERRPGGDIGGIAVHLAARIAAEARPREILVSRTVAELTAGDGRSYTPRGTPPLKGIPGEWPVLALERT